MPPFTPWEDRVPGSSPLALSLEPVLQTATPISGRIAGGLTVTLTGLRLGLDTPTVTFGGVAATSVTVVDANTVTCVTPVSTVTGPVDIVLTNAHGQSTTLVSGFTYIQTFITGLSVNRGPVTGGTTVIITGGNFQSGSTILFGGVAAVNVNFVDEQHYSVETPVHAVGSVTITIDGVSAPMPFFFTLLTRGEDIRRNPSISISEGLGNSANTCHFTVDGQSSPPQAGEIIQITDSFDGDRLLFAGVVQNVTQRYEGQITQLCWDVQCVDFLFWLNRRRPFGVWYNTSVTNIVLDLCANFAPWVDTSYVQTSLCNANVSFDGSQDFATCLSMLAKLLGAGHWYLDYERKLHFFHANVTSLGFSEGSTGSPTGEIRSSLPPGVGTAMTVTRGSKDLGGRTSGIWAFPYGSYFLFRTTFIYDNGLETSPSLISNPIFRPDSDRGHSLLLANIPIGPAIGSLTCVARRIYAAVFPISISTSGNFWKMIDLNDNVTTSLEAIINSNEASLWQAYNPGLSFTVPAVQAVPAVDPIIVGPALNLPGPTLSQSTLSTRDIGAAYDPSFVNSSLASLTWTPGWFSAKVSFVYQDGTESQSTDESNQVEWPLGLAVNAQDPSTYPRAFHLDNIPIGQPINGIPVLYRKVYLVYHGQTNPYIPALAYVKRVKTAFELSTIFDNTSTSGDFSWLFQIRKNSGDAPSSNPTNQVDPCDGDGPYLESGLPQPGTINDSDTLLLRDPALTSTVDISQVRNRVFVRGNGTTLTADATQGSTTITVADTSALPPLGGKITIGTIGAAFEIAGITTTLGGATVVLKEPLTSDVQNGATVRCVVMIEDTQSQIAMGRIEVDQNGNTSDGIREFFIDDSSLRTYAQVLARGRAELELFAQPIVTIRYGTRDPNTHPGRLVTFNLTNPPLKGTFLIQSVEIDQIHDENDTELSPRYSVSASSVKFDLEDLLLLITNGVKGAISITSGGSPGDDTSGTNVTGVVEAGAAAGESAANGYTDTQITNIQNQFGGETLTHVLNRRLTFAELNSISSGGSTIILVPGAAGYVIAITKFITIVNVTGTLGNARTCTLVIQSTPSTSTVASFTLYSTAINYQNSQQSLTSINNTANDLRGADLTLQGSTAGALSNPDRFISCQVVVWYNLITTP